MINNKKLNKYLIKEMRNAKATLKREKRRCKHIYPDYLDNEFNMLDNLFIWGYNIDPTIEPSFYTWDDAYIYYNRANNRYYMVIDTGFYDEIKDEESAWIELERLSRIEEAFRNFMTESHLSTRLEKIAFNDLGLEGRSLTEVYTKFHYILEGYRTFRKYRVNSN